MNILITGASSGIGEALALQYSRNPGNTLYICGRNRVRLNKTMTQCQKLGARVYSKLVDVTNREKMQKWIEDCEEKTPLNLIIANAGVATLDEKPENIYNTFNVNIVGTLNTITPAIELFKKRHKKEHRQIAVLSSIAGYHGLSSCPSYSASKACVKAYGESLRPNLAKYGIKFNVICPGFVRSRITDKNKFPMPFFMETDKAAKLIKYRLKRNVGLIAFPWQMRFTAWLVSILPNIISNFIYSRLPEKSDF